MTADRAGARLFRLSIGVFFFGGFLTSLISLLVPRLQLLFDLGYARALLVQLSFHASYLLFALPILAVIVRAGYMRSIATGLAVMVAGCLGLIYTQFAPNFTAVLAALLLLSGGITFLQIASNAVVTVAAPAQQAAARLTLLQGFNSLGTVLGPLLCAQFLLPDASGNFTRAGADAVVVPFIVSGAALALLSVGFALNRDMLGPVAHMRLPASRYLPLFLADRRLQLGTAAIFVYVGAEVTIGTLLTNYLMQPTILDAAPVTAGRMVALYWGGAMVGRFAGAWLMRRWSAAAMLVAVALGATVLTASGALGYGLPGAIALLAVGLCNAIMYPTIFALALPDDPKLTPIAATFLCVAVVGGAIIPYLTGLLADRLGLGPSLLLPAACYLGIAGFAWSCLAMRRASARIALS
ncbi:MFS transporter [Sphingomonas sp. PB4P5]|uniref:MFS transporter n=1 Tax=Parasphingomonas puruogangriensis TaxID=3096155 RepID=UPI002FCC9C2D